MRLTPEAGTIKTGEARVGPIHAHPIEQGFLQFVRERGQGPLFYNEPAKRSGKSDPLNPSRPPAMTARARLDEWVRALGGDDPEVSPTHGWRHTFKQIAERSGISEKIHDAITGHAAPTEGRKYSAPTVEDMSEALQRFPRYQVGGNSQAEQLQQKKRKTAKSRRSKEGRGRNRQP
ncbi:hypothetical protein XH79_06960 [Bradyrhizobium sp. CCBAU 45389]|nr:hypothetical protein [Bradyrhizobium sp. CCBAU 45389]